MNKCIFTFKGRQYTYEQFRQVLLDNYETLVEGAPEKTTSLKQISKSLRDEANRRRAEMGDIKPMGASLPDIFDMLADLIDKLDDVVEAISQLKKTNEFKSLSAADKKEFTKAIKEDYGYEETEFEKPSLEGARGEARKTARREKAERAERDEYVNAILGVYGEYDSVNMSAVKDIAGQFLSATFDARAEEIGFQEAATELIETIKKWNSEINADDSRSRLEVAFNQAVVKMLLGKAEQRGEYGVVEMVEEYNQNIGGLAATVLATRSQFPDPIDEVLPQGIREEQDRVLNEPAKNGKTTPSGKKRTKGDVVKNLRNEANKLSKEVGEEVAESEELDKKMDETTVTAPPVAPKKKEPSSRTAKKVAAKKKRDEALASLKKTFKDQGPSIGPLVIFDKKNQERVKALKQLIEAEIQMGYYTVSEIAANISKDLQGLVGKKDVRDAVESMWDEFSAMAETERKAEALEAIKNAVKTGEGDAIMKAVAKALRMMSKDYAGRKAARKKMTESAILEEILSDPEMTKAVLEQAYAVIERDVMATGAYTDIIKVSKPKNYTEDQWEALKKRFVLARVRAMLDGVIKKAEETEMQRLQEEIAKKKAALEEVKAKKAQKLEEKEQKEAEKQAENELKEAEKAYSKARKEAIKQVVKDFYGKPHDFNSIAEALVAKMPSLTFEEALELAAVVEREFEKKAESKDTRRVTELMNELVSKDEALSATKAVIRAMTTNGAMTRPNMTNALSEFLGYKGIPQSVINNLMATMQMINSMPNSPLKQSLLKKVNTTVAKYGEYSMVLLQNIIFESTVRNILSGTGTLYRGGLSVFLLSAPYYAFRMATSPIKGAKATKVVLQNIFSHRYQIRNAAREAFLANNIPYGRELPADINPYDAERPWLIAFNMKWSEVMDIWKSGQKGKAISFALAKTWIYANFQGKYFPLTNFINGAQTFLDYINVVVLRDIIAGIEAQKEAAAQLGKNASPQQYEDLWKSMIAAGTDKSMMFYNEARMEAEQLKQQGQQVPSNYVFRRMREKVAEASDKKILEDAHHNAVKAIGMGEPETFVGIVLNNIAKSPATKTATLVEGAKKMQQSPLQQAILGTALATDFLFKCLGLFARMGVVLAERGFQYAIPAVSTAFNLLPFQFETKNGNLFPVLKRAEDGSLLLKPQENLNQYIGRATVSAMVGTVIALALDAMFDDEPLEDENGNPVLDENGDPIIRKVYNPNAFGVNLDFYGMRQDLDPAEKAAYPSNTMVIGDVSVSFDAFPPFIQPLVRMLGERRDNQRKTDNEIIASMKQKGGKITYKANSPELFSNTDMIGSMMANCYNNDFTPFSKVSDIISSQNPMKEITDKMFVQTGKATVNPRIISQITQQIQDMNGQYKIYVGSNLGLDGQNFSAYLAENIWFADPFIQDRKNFESIDVFGNKVKFPPIHTDFLGMFGTSANMTAAKLLADHPEQYNLFKDSDGTFNQKMLDSFQRNIVKTYDVVVNGKKQQVETNPEIKRYISDDTYMFFGDLVNKNMDFLNKLPIKSRAKAMKYFYNISKDIAKSKNLPDAYITRKTSSQYMQEVEIEEGNEFDTNQIKLLQNQATQ